MTARIRRAQMPRGLEIAIGLRLGISAPVGASGTFGTRVEDGELAAVGP